MRNFLSLSLCLALAQVARAQWLELNAVPSSFTTTFSSFNDYWGSDPIITFDGELVNPYFGAPNGMQLGFGWGPLLSRTSSSGYVYFPYRSGSDQNLPTQILKQKDSSGSGNWLGTFPPGTAVLTSGNSEHTSGFSVYGNTVNGDLAVRGYGFYIQPVSKETLLIAQVRGWHAQTNSWSPWMDITLTRKEKRQFQPHFIGVQTTLASGVVLGTLQVRVVDPLSPLPIPFGMTIPSVRLQ